jgi:type III secretion protein HrpB1
MEMSTTLAFRTPPGGVSVPAGQSKQLGIVDVAPYERIRVVADERAGSGTGMSVRLTMTEGNELVAQLDILPLTPHSQVTRVYEVPGSKLTVFADAIGGSGTDSLDVLIYGSKD